MDNCGFILIQIYEFTFFFQTPSRQLSIFYTQLAKGPVNKLKMMMLAKTTTITKLTPCLILTLPAFTDEHVQLVKLCLKNLGQISYGKSRFL